MRVKIEHRRCCHCDTLIPMERLRLLPDTWTCAKHSEEQRRTDVEVDGVPQEERVHSAQGTLWS